MAFKFENLNEVEFIFKNNLGLGTGEQVGAFGDKSHRSKFSSWCTFKG
jgi:hypothetical protein